MAIQPVRRPFGIMFPLFGLMTIGGLVGIFGSRTIWYGSEHAPAIMTAGIVCLALGVVFTWGIWMYARRSVDAPRLCAMADPAKSRCVDHCAGQPLAPIGCEQLQTNSWSTSSATTKSRCSSGTAAA